MVSHLMPSDDPPADNTVTMTRDDAVRDAIETLRYAEASERGAVFTQAVVVELMLDLIDYKSSEDLASYCILEPSCGAGDFLLAIIERLLESYHHHHPHTAPTLDTLGNCIRAVELHQPTFEKLRTKVVAQLQHHQIIDSEALADRWLLHDDFLLTEIPLRFSHIVGNPPYVRLESIPQALRKAYRQRYTTLHDRADLYVAFFESALQLLADNGRLCFLCTNRWMKNHYGMKLRQYISDNFQLEHYINIADMDVFQREVVTYPAITTIRNTQEPLATVVIEGIEGMEGTEGELESLTALIQTIHQQPSHQSIKHVPQAIQGNAPWLLDCLPQLEVLRYIEAQCTPLEQAGCTVGIGVASGLDSVFIADWHMLDIEESRKLPLAMAKDITPDGKLYGDVHEKSHGELHGELHEQSHGELGWRRRAIINTFHDDGTLVELECFPKLHAFLSQHREALSQRYVVRRKGKAWYRTIDTIQPQLTHTPKLLIPDIKREPVIAYDAGNVYPHHNLYWITSQTWDLRALRTVLRSDVAKLFIWAYSVKLLGGWLRFQAQNLRRICVPTWESLSPKEREGLLELHTTQNIDAINQQVFALYKLDSAHIDAIKGFARTHER